MAYSININDTDNFIFVGKENDDFKELLIRQYGDSKQRTLKSNDQVEKFKLCLIGEMDKLIDQYTGVDLENYNLHPNHYTTFRYKGKEYTVVNVFYGKDRFMWVYSQILECINEAINVENAVIRIKKED